MRVLAWTAGSLAALAAVVVTMLLLLDWNSLRGEAEDAASAFLGRDVSMENLDVRPGWTTQIRVEGLKVANPDWAGEPHLADISDLAVDIRVWPLLGLNIDMPRLAIRGGTVNLERDAQGRATWNLAAFADASGEAVEPDEREDAPVIGQLEITDSRLRYVDAMQKIEVDGMVRIARAEGGKDETVELSLSGALDREKLEINFSGGPVELLKEGEEPYPVKVKARLGDTHFSADGTIGDPFTMAGLNADLALAGPNLSRLLPTLDLPLPATPPYDLKGHVVRDGDVWTISRIDGRVGDSDMTGDLTVDIGREPPSVTGNIHSRNLDFDDLGPLIGLAPDTDETASATQRQKAEARDSVFPETELDTGTLHTANLDIAFKADKVKAPPSVPVETVAFHAILQDGRLRFEPFRFDAIGGGAITGGIAVDAQDPERTPVVSTVLALQGLDLRQFFRDTAFVKEMGGRFHGKIDLKGEGRSMAQAMANARGTVSLALVEGSISGLIVEAIGLDIAEALVMVVAGDANIPLSCGRVDLNVNGGAARIDQAVVDTTDSVLLMTGEADLKNERLDVNVEAFAKDFSLIDMSAPVSVKGAFFDPSISIARLDPLPVLESGQQQDVDCAALMTGAVKYAKDKDGNATILKGDAPALQQDRPEPPQNRPGGAAQPGKDRKGGP